MGLNRLRVSLVIPAYNEESHLADCLEAIARQTVKPHEVIVVDNNSSDNTVAIARRYPFVKVISEIRQGVVYARNTGFNAVTGDIIGRIDGDTRLTTNWVASVQQIFADPSVDAVSGSVHYYDVACSPVVDNIDYAIRGWMARHMKGTFLWGANMAVRRGAWRQVAHGMCHEGRFHEDLDLAAHLYMAGLRTIYAAELRAEVSGRRIDTQPIGFFHYVRLNERSYARHHIRERKYMFPAMGLVLLTYAPLRLLYRGYDMRAGRFSWRIVFAAQTPGRVDPAVFKA